MSNNWTDLESQQLAQLDQLAHQRRLKSLARRAAYIVAMTLGLICAYWIVGGAR